MPCDVTMRRLGTLRSTAPSAGDRVLEQCLDALNAARVGTWTWDAVTDLLHLSPSAAAMHGLHPGMYTVRREEWLGTIHEDDRPRLVRAFALDAERPDLEVFYRTGSDRRPCWIAARGRRVGETEAAAPGLRGAFVEVSEWRNQAAGVRESEAFLGAMFEHLPNVVFVKDARDLRYVHVNRAAEELMGRPRAELIGKNDYDFFPVDQADFFAATDREALAGGTVLDIPAEPIDTPCGERMLHTKKIPLFDSRGLPSYVLGISDDITEQHSADVVRAREEQERHARVSRVIEHRDIEMVFQPVVELSTGRVIGAEALARFPGAGSRTPDVWFQDAAHAGLGVELEVTAIARAVEQLGALPADAFLAVNVSPATVTTRAFRAAVAQVQPSRLVLELTEHTGVDDYDELLSALGPLRAVGVRIAIDDAGAGHANLRHILNVRPDIVKLDLTLTRGIDHDPARRALAAALVRFRADIGAMLVAEGIETEGELLTLRSLEVGHGQGYFLGRPAPLPLAPSPRISEPAPSQLA